MVETEPLIVFGIICILEYITINRSGLLYHKLRDVITRLEASELDEINESRGKFVECTKLKITTNKKKAYNFEEVERFIYLETEFCRKSAIK